MRSGDKILNALSWSSILFYFILFYVCKERSIDGVVSW